MHSYNPVILQRGVALVLSLLILLVLTIVGVAAMNSTIMQERMAGNARTQAQVFETSSEGVSRSLELFYQEAEAFADEDNYDMVCGQLFGGTSNQAWAYPDPGWHLSSDEGDNPRLEQRMYCCQSWVYEEDSDIWVENPSKLFLLNRATFQGGADNSESLAMREIEVRLAEAEPDDPTCAICAPGTIGDVNGGNSNAFRVNGSCGAAVTTDSTGDAGTFIGGIPELRRGNYDGGIVAGDMGSPWNSPIALAEFVFWAKLDLDAKSYPTGSPYSGHPAEGESKGRYWDPGEIPPAVDTEHILHPDCSRAETCEIPQLHYFEGDVSMSGNAEGHGIMIVNGALHLNGTPEYKGLMVVLGGDIQVDGGGRGKPDGSFVVTHLKNTDMTGPADLFDQEILRYPVLKDGTAEEVVLYAPDDYNNNTAVRRADGTGSSGAGTDAVPVRPILVDSIGRELIHYNADDNDPSNDRFFLKSDGTEIDSAAVTFDPITNNFEFADAGGPSSLVFGSSTFDGFGRPIPDFVLVDNYPDKYGYDPNLWGWDPAIAATQLEWGETDFAWNGGGNQGFTYDCRLLQVVKHQLLCDEPSQSSLPSDPNDDFYKNPDHSGYCDHSVAEEKYGFTSPVLDNQKAWHLWNPSCDCLGVSVDADMMIAGWRENLGWRDDDQVLGCSALPSPSS